jgi:hypothetical protein
MAAPGGKMLDPFLNFFCDTYSLSQEKKMRKNCAKVVLGYALEAWCS